MVNRFNCLRHDSIICCYDKNRNICDRSTARPHRGESGMPWCIKEGNFLTIFFNLVSTNMLCNPTCFTCSNTRITQGIQKCCFPMVNVSHDGHNWRTLYQGIWIKIIIIHKETFDICIIDFNFSMCFNAIIYHQKFNSIAVQRLILRCHNPHHKEFLDNFGWFTFNPFCNFCNGHTFCVFKFFRQFMELAFCNWFWSLVIVPIILAFFIFFVMIPITILLISHLILTASILLLFSWTIFFAIKVITFLVWSSLFFPTSINCRSWNRLRGNLRLWSRLRSLHDRRCCFE